MEQAGLRWQRRFEFNWWINAHALLRPMLKAAGLNSMRALSKYELQVAYALADWGEANDGHLQHALCHWKGSGKYPKGTIGSLASHTRMIENLVHARILQNVNGRYAVSEAGRAFLGFLPKDCRDPDLPFRLAAWCSDPEASHAKVDAYLHHWFIRLKKAIPRVQENLSKHLAANGLQGSASRAS